MKLTSGKSIKFLQIMKYLHQQQSYTCPMHPEIVQDSQGNCPVCKMNLVPLKVETAKKTFGHQHDNVNTIIGSNQEISILYDGANHSESDWKGHFSNMR